ncbi:pyridoxamine 5'-phosphate oxidase family protein [Algoriphagus halophilus]|uniref:General stress protein 26 n=1 Tax=Algoriphagus halophilus TaxID=226505 RepID=A0A1N6D898_9BACT|nr:pyridoxamine 5'-phosphate oxidase family protein [Algoriphagus halophilus]SIN67020.1 General stress protein 26 [Algoriphagus halophilus]
METSTKETKQRNVENLSGKAAVSKIRELVDSSGLCFFQTEVSFDENQSARPMSIQKSDEDGTLWFLSSIESAKNAEINNNPKARLFFQKTSSMEFLELRGTAKISQDKKMIHELWDGIAKNWFPQGKDDPRISIIQFTPEAGHYWDTKHGAGLAGAKMLFGLVTGKPMKVGVEGELDV